VPSACHKQIHISFKIRHYKKYPAGNKSKQIVLPELLTTGAIVEKIVGSKQ
jgi:hypothetical protein